MRIDTRPRRKNAPRPAEKAALGYLQWLRGRDCVMAFNCEGKTEAAHVDHGGDKGMATKASDRFALPMCAKHHREQHSKGWATFQHTYGSFDALGVAAQYWSRWPGRLAWERKVFSAEKG